jgi:hypothetical protein
VHVLQHGRQPIHVFARAGAQAKMVQADTLLDKAFISVCRITRLDADRCPASHAVEEALAIE